MAKIRAPTSSGSGSNGWKILTLLMTAGGYLIGYLHGGNSAQELSSSSLLCSSSALDQLQQHEVAAEKRDDGWKSINVFYGNEDHLVTNWISKAQDLKDKKKWFSQFQQDEVIATLLREKRNGYFIDLAANNAYRLSNSYSLEQSYGWNGLCIEPNPKYWQELAYRKCHVVAAVVGKNRMEEINYSFPKVGVYGGIVREGFDNSAVDESVTEKRYTVSLQEILERAGAPPVIDYFSLDVEGAEWYILEGFPFDQYKVKIMTVERPNAQLKKLLEQHNYQFVALIARIGETLWVHKDYASELDMAAFHKLNITKS